MGCLKGGVAANAVIPTPDYVRFATHYRFRPDFCQAADPQSKGVVEALVRYAQTDLAVPLLRAGADAFDVHAVDLDAANAVARTWCEVNAVEHSETCAVPARRLVEIEAPLLAPLPSLRPAIGRRELRKVWSSRAA